MIIRYFLIHPDDCLVFWLNDLIGGGRYKFPFIKHFNLIVMVSEFLEISAAAVKSYIYSFILS